jgi:hypothetical protein
MSIALTGSGSLFVRLGHLFGWYLDQCALAGGTATARVLSTASYATRMATLLADAANGTAMPGPLGNLAQSEASLVQSSQQQLYQYVQSVAQGYVIGMVQAVYPQTPSNLNACMQQLVEDIIGQAGSVNQSAPVVGAQANVSGSGTSNVPVGNPNFVLSTKNGRGLLLEYVLPETLTFTCSADSYNGGAIAGQESFTVSSQPALQPSAYNWPGGSGLNGVTAQLVNGVVSNTSTQPAANMLVNSDFFTTTTPNVPDNWNENVGAAGTDFFAGAGLTPFTTGGGALKITGTGSALLDGVTQTFGTASAPGVGAGGSPALLLPDTVYHVNGWMKTSSTPAAGVLEGALTDGTAYPGNVLVDDQGVNVSATKSLTAVSTTYIPFSFPLRTPAVLTTTTPALRLRLSTAISSGKSLFLGRVSMVKPAQLYGPQGPFMSGHSGSINCVGGLNPDTYSAALTNTFGVIQLAALRFFGMTSLGTALGLILPSSGSPTISDALVL